jgi:predicted nuclease of restriction endonuclease-like (RecB) superfamily
VGKKPRTKSLTSVLAPRRTPVYQRIRKILNAARTSAGRSVNTIQVISNWLIGREIVEEEQRGATKAEYGRKLIEGLSVRLQRDFGGGYSATNLKLFRQFFLIYPHLMQGAIGHTVCDQLWNFTGQLSRSSPELDSEISHTACDRSWTTGRLHPNLSWSLYRHLLRVDSDTPRNFYEIEAIRNCWSARELERQINSLLFERLASSKDKHGVLRLAQQGQEIIKPIDVFKDPIVIEFLGLPESPKLAESDLETALLDQLQAFLLELGRGFAFVARQKRITLDGDHFYIDLVFYHIILKCYVLIDLKVGKLTHTDLGQLQLYVNYHDEECRSTGDNPTLGLILCTDKNDAVVKYTLGPEQSQKIFASRYQLHLPTEAELRAELRRETRQLSKQLDPQRSSRRPVKRKPRLK